MKKSIIINLLVMLVAFIVVLSSGCSKRTDEIPKVVTGITTEASSEHGEFVAVAINYIVENHSWYSIDGDTSTYWCPLNTLTLQENYITFITSETHRFSKITLQINGDPNDAELENGGGKDYHVEYWSGDEWVVIVNRQHGKEDKNAEIPLADTFDAAYASTALRLVYESTYGHVPVVNEAEIEEIVKETRTVWIWNSEFWSD